ncbi:elongation of very long chain fatty acids protein 4-like [Argiope bruennichi]|uniref:elongation of very long chain fatty acids protein 4-like n=1 Tax=Argiope bruennichi TaxID=94029 RepID=UPI002494E4D5|nr:elongation of very long chain fatty acids protein 4-like [Argiope bruennichi]
MFASTIYDFFTANPIGKYLNGKEYQCYGILVGYVLFVTWLGPSWMRARKPFDLKIPMIVYNFFMSAFNFVSMTQLYTLTINEWDMRCYTGSPETLQIVQGKLFILWNIVLEKYLALFDTIFFVLRKKQNQISFLHVYHHIVACLLVTWIGAAPDLIFFIIISMLLNSFVHVIMYFYYGLSAFGKSIQKYLWWKRYLTIIQIVQFLLVIAYIIISVGTGCEKMTNLQIFYVFFVVSILVLFIIFYRNSFKRKKIE